MNQELIDRCPFRENTASRLLYLAIARAGELTKAEIAKAAHLSVAKVATLLAAYVNPMHRAPMDRVGVRLVRTKARQLCAEALQTQAGRPSGLPAERRRSRSRRPRRGKPLAAPESEVPVPAKRRESESGKGYEKPSQEASDASCRARGVASGFARCACGQYAERTLEPVVHVAWVLKALLSISNPRMSGAVSLGPFECRRRISAVDESRRTP